LVILTADHRSQIDAGAQQAAAEGPHMYKEKYLRSNFIVSHPDID